MSTASRSWHQRYKETTATLSYWVFPAAESLTTLSTALLLLAVSEVEFSVVVGAGVVVVVGAGVVVVVVEVVVVVVAGVDLAVEAGVDLAVDEVVWVVGVVFPAGGSLSSL